MAVVVALVAGALAFVGTQSASAAGPDLVVTKTDGVTTAQPGDVLTYFIDVCNHGSAVATGIQVTDTIPLGTTFISGNHGATFSAGVVSWGVFTLGPPGCTRKEVTVSVNNPAAAGQNTIVNTAKAVDDGTNGADLTPSNNTATDTDTLNANPDLSASKTDGLASVTPGQTWTYTITAKNTGNQGASGVVIKDTLPPGTVFVSASNGGTFAAGAVTYPTIGLAGGGASVSRTVTVSLPSAATVGENSVAAGELFTCFLQGDSTVKCAGHNGSGQIGDGTTNRRLAATTVSGLANVKAIAAGREHACALLNDGTVKCWGGNGSGQLGDGTSTRRLTPVSVVGLSNVVQIEAGQRHTCARLATGALRCWGENGSGQLGDGTVTRRTTPVAVSGITTAVNLSVGGDSSCAVVSGGGVKCWGENGNGQLGDGTTTRRNTPVSVVGITNGSQVAVGASHACVVLAPGTVNCFGRNNNGQLGDGTTTDRKLPVAVSGLAGVNQVQLGDFHSCARLASDGSLKCWGANNDGRLGDNSTTQRLTPVAVAGPLPGVRAFSLGANHTCALVGAGFRCWGNNTQGQFGNGTKSNSDEPTPVLNSNGPGSGGPTSLTNTVNITDDGANGADPTPSNNTGTDTDTVS